jgi:hypothetical protein
MSPFYCYEDYNGRNYSNETSQFITLFLRIRSHMNVGEIKTSSIRFPRSSLCSLFIMRPIT